MKAIELITTLQMAIGPVILISGVGLLMLSMTNRFGRVIDRTRLVAQAHRAANAAEKPRHAGQLAMLRRRGKLLRGAITLATLSVLAAAFLVVTIFLGALREWTTSVSTLIVVIFLASMLFLIASLAFFIRDLHLSLDAMNLDTADIS